MKTCKTRGEVQKLGGKVIKKEKKNGKFSQILIFKVGNCSDKEECVYKKILRTIMKCFLNLKEIISHPFADINFQEIKIHLSAL